jgi:hypothetical protein
MTVTATSFRQQFQAFSDPSVYDDATINSYINIAVDLLDANRWAEQLDYGTSLFTAHHLVLIARDNAFVSAGGIPGTVQSIINQKQVDKVSVSYDTQEVLIKGGDYWNMTSYGIRFLHMARMMGAGGIIAGGLGPLGFGSGAGWPGFVDYDW